MTVSREHRNGRAVLSPETVERLKAFAASQHLREQRIAAGMPLVRRWLPMWIRTALSTGVVQAP